MTGLRKKTYKTKLVRLKRALRREPTLPSKAFSERFGMTRGAVTKIAHKLGIELPSGRD
jgi:hypothetical protein